MEKKSNAWIAFMALSVVLFFSLAFFLRHAKTAPTASFDQYTPQIAHKIPTTEQVVGQMFMWGIKGPILSSASAEMLQQTHAGGVLVTGNMTSEELKNFVLQLRQVHTDFPLLIAIDQEGGKVKRVRDDLNPGAQALARLSKEAMCDAIASTTAILRESGVDANFGIVADVGWTKNGYITARTYGETPEIVSVNTSQAILCSQGVLRTLKHFPGHGRTAKDSHQELPEIDINQATWATTDALPFRDGIEKGAEILMFGHLVYPAIDAKPASISKPMHDIAASLGFAGITITDDLGMLERTYHNPNQILEDAIGAGNTMLLYADTISDPKSLFTHAVSIATASKELQDALKRNFETILRYKKVQ